MQKLAILILFYFITCAQTQGGSVVASDQGKNVSPPEPDEVLIGPNGVIMPLRRILLIRKGSDYCAVEFTNFWTGKTDEDLYAAYESYYQDDKTGDFTNKNVKFKKGELSSAKPRWIGGGHTFSFGNKEIQCGYIRLWWTGKGAVYFFGNLKAQSDYGIELAPTPWTTISEVNVFDPRVKWYRYDETRKRVNIPIDKLWEEKK